MNLSTKIFIAAGVAYVLNVNAKRRRELETNEALKHSVDRRLSVEGAPTFKSVVLGHLSDRISRKVGSWLYDGIESQSRSAYLDSRYDQERSQKPRNGRVRYITRYARFGRRGNN